MGKGTTGRSDPCRWRSDRALLADSHRDSPENVHSSSDHEFRRNPRTHPRRVGPLLYLRRHLEALAMHADGPRLAGFYFSLEAVSTDVCRNRHFHRQREAQKGKTFRPLDRQAMPQTLPGETHARAQRPRMDASARSILAHDANDESRTRDGKSVQHRRVTTRETRRGPRPIAQIPRAIGRG